MKAGFLVAAMWWGLTGGAWAQAASPHCHESCPPAAWGVAITRHQAFTYAVNPHTRIAQWVAYKITADSLGPRRDRRWMADPLAPEEAALEPDDYRRAARAGYDRGHLAPLASLAGNPGWRETNFATNLAPQTARLNRGAWARQEATERALVRRRGYDAVYVVVIPLYERTMPPLPQADEPHQVPSGFEKRITAVKNGKTRHLILRFEQ